MGMFRISTFLPSTVKPQTDGPGTDKTPWQIAWRRRAMPQTGGQNYSLAYQSRDTRSLSGPLNIISNPFRPLEPTKPIDVRSLTQADVSANGLLHGQMFTQPLVNPATGGYAQSMIPTNAAPFNVNGILPAGAC